MTWWAWMVLGAVLLGAELFAVDAQFYLVFLGVSAAVVGLATLFGIVLPEWGQWLAFAVISLAFFLTFRKALYEKLRSGGQGFENTISGDSVTVTDNLEPGANARAEYRGTEWTIRNVGATAITAGSRAKVVKADGVTLHVEAE
ncbi:MAG: NfeD family protein [Gammaproteobacteria bacterium]|nr:NfeD family protein [Gammaproteobacteria bacterium]MDH3410601.1 NfeD family protein [Gammaproteobacteria bacterium]MDH3553269.1 NfeD family protein [Gammaproteobacteria bacterium]